MRRQGHHTPWHSEHTNTGNRASRSQPPQSEVNLPGFYAGSPDFSVAMIATAATGVLWAVFRLVVAYSGQR